MGTLSLIGGTKHKGIVLLLLVAGSAAGCWHYSTSGSLLPSHIRSVAVPLLGNETTWEYGIKERLTDAIIEAFTSDNTLTVTGEREADSIVRGTILTIKEIPFTFDQEEQVQEYKMRIVLTIQFEDVRKRKIIWEESAMEGWGTYATEDEEWEDGIDRAIEKLASDIVNKTVAGW